MHPPENNLDHDGGLAADLTAMLQLSSDRRQTLRWLLAGASALPMAGCGGGSSASGGAAPAPTATPVAPPAVIPPPAVTPPPVVTPPPDTTPPPGVTPPPDAPPASCSAMPEEIVGPFPADGTNSTAGRIVNVLNQSGVVRSDIRRSFNGPTGVAAGVPLTIRLQVVNTNAGCAPLAGYAIYIWQCDRDGNYSLYSPGLTDQNFLRGVQVSDANGGMAFTTVYPGCYPGRVPHVHLEIYRSLAAAGTAANRIRTSQFTFPAAVSNAVYATPAYSASVANMAAINFATDMVFRDGFAQQMVSITGNVMDGYVATLTIGVAA